MVDPDGVEDKQLSSSVSDNDDINLIAAKQEFAANFERFIVFAQKRALQGDLEVRPYLAGLLSNIDPTEASRWDDVSGFSGRTFWRSRQEFPLRIQVIRLAARGSLLSAAKQGHAFAIERTGDLAYSDRSEKEAIRWYSVAANNGRVSAMFSLHELLWTSDRQKALYWLQMSAEGGYTPAMLSVANLLAKVDWVRSQFWLEKARSAGDPLASRVEEALTKDYRESQN